MFSDQTGRFPVRAASGNQYIMISYHVDAKTISAECFKRRNDNELIQAYEKIMAKYKAKGLKVALHVLDNEASAAYRKAITDHNVTFHLVPPHIHRQNKVEQSIRTFKEHLKAILAGIDDSYPLKHWDVLIPHVEMGLNLMRQSNICLLYTSDAADE